MIKYSICGLIMGFACLTMAREWRTPRVFDYTPYPYAHYPFLRVDGNCFDFNIWAGGFYRTADEAFLNEVTTHKENLSGIFFGKSTFTLADLGITTAVPVSISPKISYNEKDAFFGFNAEWVTGCECDWRVGVRAVLPFRALTTSFDNNCTFCLSETSTQSSTNLCFRQNELVCDEDGNQQFVADSWTCRLDYLSQLLLANNSADHFVTYQDPNRGNIITFGGQDATNRNTIPPIMVVSRPDGTPPLTPWARRETANAGCTSQPAVNTLLPLGATGAGLAANERAIFDSGTNYTPLSLNTAQQAMLWVVPSANSGGVGTFDLNQEARTIQARINAIVRSASSTTASSVLNASGIDFQTQKRAGVGDLDVELYARRDWCSFFTQYIAGLRLPTGRTVTDPAKVLLTPTGNDGHFELRGGMMFGWNPNDWFGLKLDGFYNYAINRQETVAARFVGQSVKNIGPAIPADIHWQYLILDADCTILIPCIEPGVGFDLGMQLYKKSRDHVSFRAATAIDLSGALNMLDPNVLELRTEQDSWKVKSEIFYQSCDWHVFAGFQHIFAGKNAANESDWYLGIQLYF